MVLLSWLSLQLVCVTGSISPREHYESVLEKSSKIIPPTSEWRTSSPWPDTLNGNSVTPASFSAGFGDYGYHLCIQDILVYFECQLHWNQWQ